MINESHCHNLFPSIFKHISEIILCLLLAMQHKRFAKLSKTQNWLQKRKKDLKIFIFHLTPWLMKTCDFLVLRTKPRNILVPNLSSKEWMLSIKSPGSLREYLWQPLWGKCWTRLGWGEMVSGNPARGWAVGLSTSTCSQMLNSVVSTIKSYVYETLQNFKIIIMIK